MNLFLLLRIDQGYLMITKAGVKLTNIVGPTMWIDKS